MSFILTEEQEELLALVNAGKDMLMNAWQRSKHCMKTFVLAQYHVRKMLTKAIWQKS